MKILSSMIKKKKRSEFLSSSGSTRNLFIFKEDDNISKEGVGTCGKFNVDGESGAYHTWI